MKDFDEEKYRVLNDSIFSFNLPKEGHYIDLIKENHQGFEESIRKEKPTSKLYRELRWFLDSLLSLNRFFARQKLLVSTEDIRQVKIVFSRRQEAYAVYCSYPVYREEETQLLLKELREMSFLDKMELKKLRKQNLKSNTLPIDLIDICRRSAKPVISNYDDENNRLELVSYIREV